MTGFLSSCCLINPITYAIFSRWVALLAEPAVRMLSLSPYFQTSLASSYSILYFVRVGSEMEGISPAFIWSYHAFAILSSAVIDFFSSSSLDIEIHHHLFIIVNTPDFQHSPALSGIRYRPDSLRGIFAFQTLVNWPSISLTKSALGTASAALSGEIS